MRVIPEPISREEWERLESALREELARAKAEYDHAMSASADGHEPDELSRRQAAITRYSNALRKFSEFILGKNGSSKRRGKTV